MEIKTFLGVPDTVILWYLFLHINDSGLPVPWPAQ